MADLSLVLERGEDVGASEQLDVSVRAVGPDLFEQILDSIEPGRVPTTGAMGRDDPNADYPAARAVSEILSRYPEDNPVHRAIGRSAPTLLAADPGGSSWASRPRAALATTSSGFLILAR